MKTLAPMAISRSNHGFVAHNGKLWAVGGTDGEKPISDVESYDPYEN